MSELFIIPNNIIYILQQCETKLGYFNRKKYNKISTNYIKEFLLQYKPELNPKALLQYIVDI